MSTEPGLGMAGHRTKLMLLQWALDALGHLTLDFLFPERKVNPVQAITFRSLHQHPIGLLKDTES